MAGVLGRLIAARRADPEAAAIPLAYLARLQRAFDVARPPDDGTPIPPGTPYPTWPSS